MGISLGQYYAQFGGSGGPTPPPTATAMASAFPAPTNTAFPTATLQPGAQTATFDDLYPQGRTLNGQYPSGLIDWGTNVWYLSGPYGQFGSNNIGFNGAGPTSASFTFLSPHRLVQIDADNGGTSSSTISLSCDGTLATEVTLSAAQLQSIPMGWIGNCTTVTVGSTNG